MATAKNIIDLSGLSHFWSKAKEWISGQISSATESINDIIDNLKLANITDVTASAKEVNYTKGVTSAIQDQLDAKAPKASPNFTGVPTAPTATTGTATTQVATCEFVSSAVSVAKEELTTSLAAALEYKGTKDTYSALPTSGNKVGDVWNVVAAYGNTPAGTNYAWDGSKWDPLGGDVDLSNYLTEDDLSFASNTEIEGIFS